MSLSVPAVPVVTVAPVWRPSAPSTVAVPTDGPGLAVRTVRFPHPKPTRFPQWLGKCVQIFLYLLQASSINVFL